MHPQHRPAAKTVYKFYTGHRFGALLGDGRMPAEPVLAHWCAAGGSTPEETHGAIDGAYSADEIDAIVFMVVMICFFIGLAVA